jgi:hypothetical protein
LKRRLGLLLAAVVTVGAGMFAAIGGTANAGTMEAEGGPFDNRATCEDKRKFILDTAGQGVFVDVTGCYMDRAGRWWFVYFVAVEDPSDPS